MKRTICKHCEHKFIRKPEQENCEECGARLTKRHRRIQSQPESSSIPSDVSTTAAEPNHYSLVFPYRADVVFQLGKDRNKYIVTFTGELIHWVYCPNRTCNKKLFENTTLRGASNHRCPRCGSDITFIFQ